MPVRRFVVVTLPARDTRLGALAADAGCRIRLVARRAPGPAYDIAFEADAIAGDVAREAADDLSNLASFWYSSVEPELAKWSASARVPVDHVSSRTCRALCHATLDAGWAWLVLDGGVAQLRLLPGPGVPANVFAREVQEILSLHGAPWDLYVSDIESSWYDEACQSNRPMLVA